MQDGSEVKEHRGRQRNGGEAMGMKNERNDGLTYVFYILGLIVGIILVCLLRG